MREEGEASTIYTHTTTTALATVAPATARRPAVLFYSREDGTPMAGRSTSPAGGRRASLSLSLTLSHLPTVAGHLAVPPVSGRAEVPRHDGRGGRVGADVGGVVAAREPAGDGDGDAGARVLGSTVLQVALLTSERERESKKREGGRREECRREGSIQGVTNNRGAACMHALC